jgi:hypothetical protein
MPPKNSSAVNPLSSGIVPTPPGFAIHSCLTLALVSYRTSTLFTEQPRAKVFSETLSEVSEGFYRSAFD